MSTTPSGSRASAVSVEHSPALRESPATPPSDNTGDPTPPRPNRSRVSRRALLTSLIAGATGVVVVGAAEVITHHSPKAGSATSPTAPSATPSDAPGVSGWTSGASGDGAADGSLATWRGTPLGIASTWADNNAGMVEIPQLAPGGEYADWSKPLDIAIGAIGAGETWKAAATGAYAQRWVRSLTVLRQRWGARQSTLHIRFAHEMNGNWYPWAVSGSEGKDFTASWKQFRTMQKDIFPAAKLVFCVNRESSGGQADWRSYFPGAEEVDVMGVDYYNQNPGVASQAQWDASMTMKDVLGAPKGLEAHRLFAKEAGLPLAVPEWSEVAGQGDSPVFVDEMHRFFARHGGTGAGQVLYEVLFNADNDNGKFQLFAPHSILPKSAAEYRKKWTSAPAG